MNAGIKKDVQIDPANRDDPVKKPTQCTKMIERIAFYPEYHIEQTLEAFECIAANTLYLAQRKNATDL